MRWFLVALIFAAACGDDGSSAPDAGPPPREVVLETEVDDSGLSPDVMFTIPESTRSLTVVIEGEESRLYALGALTLGDGVDLVDLPSGDPGAAMQGSYNDEQIGQMDGDLFQSIRLGTYTHVYPYRPGQEAVPGAASLRVASDTAGPVRVTILMPEDDGARTLPLNIFIVSDTLADPTSDTFVTELERIFGQADIELTINGVERITGSALARITQATEPQEAPDSQTAMLPALVEDRELEGLDIFFVESLPTGIGGMSLGTPGPPLRGSYYFGVVVRGTVSPLVAALVVAHEGSHFADPLDDTTPNQDNLMEDGTVLTDDQAFALSRSALLVP